MGLRINQVRDGWLASNWFAHEAVSVGRCLEGAVHGVRSMHAWQVMTRQRFVNVLRSEMEKGAVKNAQGFRSGNYRGCITVHRRIGRPCAQQFDVFNARLKH